MNSRSSLLKTGSFGLSARNLIRQTYSKVDYAEASFRTNWIPPSTVLSPGWPSTLGFLQQIELADFIPTPWLFVACECLKTKVPNISVFSAAMQGGFWLRSVLNVDMISLQPTFMMFTDGLIKIKTKKNSAFTGLILKLCFTAIIYYVWRERNSRFFEGNPSSKQNVVLENCKGSQTETAFGFLSDET